MSGPTDGDVDLGLLEYVLVSGREPDGLAPVAEAVVQLARAGSIRLLDAVVLRRESGSTRVTSGSPAGHAVLSGLMAVAEGHVLLSVHDVELASMTLDPEETALLLLVEDRWANILSDAARQGGARLTAGERIARDRVLASLEQAGATDLIVRSPGTTASFVDQAAQVRELARLVDRGLLTLDRYEVQRRRVLGV